MLLCDAADDVKSELFIVVVVAVFAALSFNNSVAFVFEGKKKKLYMRKLLHFNTHIHIHLFLFSCFCFLVVVV